MAFRLQRQILTAFAAAPATEEHDPNLYILDLENTLDLSMWAASLSDGSISIMDGTFRPVCAPIRHHTDRVNAIATSPASNSVVFSASSDRTVCIWDARTAATGPQGVLTLPGEVSAVAVGAGGNLLSTAHETVLGFYDVRQLGAGPLGEYADCHTDEITQVKFHPAAGSTMVISGAEDGLICVYNTAVAANEEAVVSIFNTECPTRRIGYFGPGGEGDCITSQLPSLKI